jgi:trehalose-6-phosphatase
MRAARLGDPAAFHGVCDQLYDPCAAAVHRALGGDEPLADKCVRMIIERAWQLAFDELSEKPRDWSTYGWITWIVSREAIAWNRERRLGMPHTFRVIAIDYDGTIAESDRADSVALDAIDELRRRGYRVLLCTGRIPEELFAVFPDVQRHFDAIIAENGAVLIRDGGIDAQDRALPVELADSLRNAGIPFRAGHVLLATEARYADAILPHIRELGLESQLVYNRDALMVLPEGVSKGAGLLHALGQLELSRHSTIAIGDAENDHTLLTAAEIGVAVGNAVPALRAHADICLTDDDGAGVAAFLRGPVLSGSIDTQPARWSVPIGIAADGKVVRVPGSRTNMLIAGASCAGKSYLAGLLIERLIALDYTVCVFDAEGDHAELASLAGVIAVGGGDGLPSPDRLVALVRNRFSSVIADLSMLSTEQKRAYCDGVLEAMGTLRQQRGYPQWLVIEEADQLLAERALPVEPYGATPVGYCLVTHRPMSLHPEALAAIDVVLALPGAERYARVPVADGSADVEQPFTLEPRCALLATRTGSVRFEPAARHLRHVRHRHKYTRAQVPPERRFHFGPPGPDSRTAGNLVEFRDELARATRNIVHRHLRAGDFSRWIRDVLADDELGRRIREIERWSRSDPSADPEAAVAAMVGAIEVRYDADPLAGESPDAGSPRTTSTGHGAPRTTA